MKSIGQFKVIDGFFRIFQTSESIKCFIPSEQEQTKISNIMDVINHVITLCKNKILLKLLNTMFI